MIEKKYAIAAAVGSLFVMLLIYFGMRIGYQNKEVRLRKMIEAKQLDNKNEYDNTWKQISQAAQVTDAQKKALIDIAVQYAQARSDGSNNLMFKAVHETVPNMDASTFTNLQNIILGARNRFSNNQKQLIDYKREHDILLDSPVSGWFLAGTEKVDIRIVTSSRTENAFDVGIDDDTDVFRK